MQKHRLFWLPFLLFLALWLPRTFTLDAFVSTDEQKWLTRSANFYQALVARDWEHTFQREHPGVTVMYAGMLGLIQTFPAYARVAPAQFTWTGGELEQFLAQQGDVTPLALLAAGRWWVALFTALALTLGYFPLRRLFGAGLAAAITLYVGWAPFALGLSRLLHPEGMAASLIYLALLLWLAWLYTAQSRGQLIAAGVAMGLAWLTKTPAIFLVPVGALLLSLEIGQQWRDRAQRRQLLTHYVVAYVLWGVIATITFVGLWPAMWIDPLGVLTRMWSEIYVYMDHHDVVNFYQGELVADPGLSFYPVAWLLRTTPTTVLGCACLAIVLLRGGWPLNRPAARRAAWGVLLFALFFALGMSVGAKKFDRYLLPALLMVDLLALLGWAGMLRWVGTRFHWSLPRLWPAWRSQVWIAIPYLLLVAAQLGVGLPHFPYYLTYYNQLAGGGGAAQQALMTGWGEGLDAAARWINAQPNGKAARVVSWYNIGPLSYFLDSQAPTLDFWQGDFWTEADYAVVYVNQAQRDLPDAALLTYLQQYAPVHTVTFRGNALAWIYDLRTMTPPATVEISADHAVSIDNTLRLAGFTVQPTAIFTDELTRVQLYLEALTALPATYTPHLQLTNSAGEVVWETPMPPNGVPTAWSAGTVRRFQSTIALPPSLTAGHYDLQVRHQAAETPTLSASASITGGTYLLTPLDLYTPIDVPTNEIWPSAQLTQIRHAATIGDANHILVALRFQGPIDPRCKLSLRLQDEQGTTIAQVDKPLAADMRFSLDVPEEATAERYTLVAVVYDAATMNSIPDQEGSHIVSLISDLVVEN